MSRLKTNNNEYKQAIEEYILECIESEDQELITPEDKIKHLFMRYDGEYNLDHNKRRYPNNQERLANYLMGLPFSFAFMNYKILGLVKNLHNVEELTNKEEETVLANYWMHLSHHILRLKDKYLN